jgi:hypothetical protein
MISPRDHAVWTELLSAAIDALPEQFKIGELAALTATHKIEIPVRDAIAAYVGQLVQDDGYTVIRELKLHEAGKSVRRDLAILDSNGAAVLELEAKALLQL